MNQIIVSALIAIITSGATSAITVHFLENRRKRHEVRREKAEQLYIFVQSYVKAMDAAYTNFSALISGRKPPEEAEKSSKDIIEALHPQAIENIQMIVNIYFPSLKVPLAEVMDCRNTFSATITEFRKEPKYPATQTLTDIISNIIHDAHVAEKKLLAAIARENLY